MTTPASNSPLQSATHLSRAAAGGFVLLLVGVWAYWPTLVWLVGEWSRQPDYSHGLLVVPIAVGFLWYRRDRFPATSIQPSLWGAVVLIGVLVARVLANMFYMASIDGWTLPLWIGGGVLLVFGWSCLRWSLPSIVFLWFMVPIPYTAERWLSLPLQSVATRLSTAILQMLGQPAIAEGHTIWLGAQTLFVEEACSGLRIFVGIVALAFAFVLFTTWPWWQKAMVLLAALPVALIANALRIVGTGLLNQLVSGEVANRFSHDFSGFVMIPLAAVLLWMFIIYLDRLFPEVEEVKPSLPSR